MAHRKGISLFKQNQKTAIQDLIECYTPSQLFGLALHFKIYAKRYLQHKNFVKAAYYFKLYQKIINMESVKNCLPGSTKQMELNLIY